MRKVTYYTEDQRRYVEFPVDEKRIIVSPLGGEMSVYFTFCGREYHVYTRTAEWDRENSTIPANVVGEVGGNVLVSFPATMLDGATLEMPKTDVMPISEPLLPRPVSK